MFARNSETPVRPQAKPMSGSTFSVLGSDVAIKGNISAGADLHIDGKVEGDITCTSLVQGEGGEVIGTIKAESARIAGKVTGTVTVGQLVVLKTARIEGDVFYDALTIEQGAQVDGRFAHREPEPRLTLAVGGEG